MNQSFLQDILRRDVHVVLFGTVEARPGLQLINPDYEVIDAATARAGDADEALTIHTGRIVPVYEKAGAMTPKMQRRLVFDVLVADAGRPARSVSRRGAAAPESARPPHGADRDAFSAAADTPRIS